MPSVEFDLDLTADDLQPDCVSEIGAMRAAAPGLQGDIEDGEGLGGRCGTDDAIAFASHHPHPMARAFDDRHLRGSYTSRIAALVSTGLLKMREGNHGT